MAPVAWPAVAGVNEFRACLPGSTASIMRAEVLKAADDRSAIDPAGAWSKVTTSSFGNSLEVTVPKRQEPARQFRRWHHERSDRSTTRGMPAISGAGPVRSHGGGMTDNLTRRVQPDRSKINMHEAHEVKYWTHALGVTREDLQKAVDKVGNSAPTVRKQLGLSKP
jgi:hypothetical protein